MPPPLLDKRRPTWLRPKQYFTSLKSPSPFCEWQRGLLLFSEQLDKCHLKGVGYPFREGRLKASAFSFACPAVTTDRQRQSFGKWKHPSEKRTFSLWRFSRRILLSETKSHSSARRISTHTYACSALSAAKNFSPAEGKAAAAGNVPPRRSGSIFRFGSDPALHDLVRRCSRKLAIMRTNDRRAEHSWRRNPPAAAR